MRKLLAIFLLLVTGAAAQNKVGLFSGIPNCSPSAAAGFTVPTWQPNTQYYGVLNSQSGAAWAQFNGNFYKVHMNSVGTFTSGTTGPTCTSGTCSDGSITWIFEANNNGQCADDVAHFVLPNIDFVSLFQGWGADNNSLGVEKSNVGNTASGGYSYTAFDATITNGSTGIMDNPNWPAGAKVNIIFAPMGGAPGPNAYTPYYVYSTTYQGTVGAASPQNVASCTAYPGNSNLSTTHANSVVNANTAGLALSDLATGEWLPEKPVMTAYEAYLANALAHYSQSYIGYFRLGWTNGESFPPCYTTMATFYGFNKSQMQTQWMTNFIVHTVNAVGADVPPHPVQVVTNCNGCTLQTNAYDYTFPALMATAAEGLGTPFWLGGNGLSNADISTFNAHGAAQGSGVSSDHAYFWKTYPNTSKVFQTLGFTTPDGTGNGALQTLLPWQQFLQKNSGVAQPPAMYYEAFWQDLCIAYCPNYTNGTLGYPTYHFAYQNVITNFRAGQAQPAQIGTGSGTGHFSIGAPCGPPTFPCSTHAVGVAPASVPQLFTSTEYVGKVSCTASPNVCTLQSGSQFLWSNAATNVAINNANNTVASVTDSTHFVPGTPLTANNVPYALCDGQCQNYSTYDNVNPAGIDCITRLLDLSTTKNAQDVNNLTCSGGANNPAISSLEDYAGPALSGGAFPILHVSRQNGCMKVLNPGINPLYVTCPAGFGRNPLTDDRTVFEMTNQTAVGATQGMATLLVKQTFDSLATTFQTTTNLVDFGACPGVYPIIQGGGFIDNDSELVMSNDDNVFPQSFGTISAQGFNYIMAFYKVSTNQCRAVDLYTGNVWDWCTVGIPGDSCALEAPLTAGLYTTTTTPADTNSCWGVSIYTGQAQVAVDGMTVTPVPPATTFPFSQKQNVAFHSNSLNSPPGAQITGTPAGFNCSASNFHCDIGFTLASGSTSLTFNVAQTAAKLNCASLPCIVFYAAVNGIHGVQISGDANFAWASFGANGGWGDAGATLGGQATTCAGDITNTQVTYIPVTNTVLPYQQTQWATPKQITTQGISGYMWGNHPSMGLTHTLSANYSGPNIRLNSDLTHWTQFAGSNLSYFSDVHGTWPSYCNGVPAGATDTCMWIEFSDNPLASLPAPPCGNYSQCPGYLNLVAFTYNPNGVFGVSDTPPAVFFHTGACGLAVSNANCPGGTYNSFGGINSINYTGPLSNWSMWASPWLLGLGKNADGTFETSAFGGVLQ